jgi:hypothetical protein
MGTFSSSLRKQVTVLDDDKETLSNLLEEEKKKNSDLHEEIAKGNTKIKDLEKTILILKICIIIFFLLLFCVFFVIFRHWRAEVVIAAPIYRLNLFSYFIFFFYSRKLFKD